MHRHRLQDMQEWLHRPGRKPLILRGARQVGKSTLVRLFCDAAADRDLLTVNLERHPDLAETFASNDPATVLDVIEAVSDRSRSESTILFLDEIQAAPSAFAALRYFFEEVPELPIVAAGSLMEFMLSDHSFSMPVGRIQYLDLGPMTFTEFLQAVGQDRLAREIETFEWNYRYRATVAATRRSPPPSRAPAPVPLRRRHARGGQDLRRVSESARRQYRARQHHRYVA